jgi:hypothetical protein
MASQQRYLNSIVDVVDPNALNPFDNSSPVSENIRPTEELVDLPFRFTQWQLNPGGKAASGQWSREAVGRSPATSGALASELAGIQSQLGNTEIEQQDGVQETSGEDVNTSFNYPTKKWEIPRGISLYGMNPITAAQRFAAYKDKLSPEELKNLGPMDYVEGYDMKGILGEGEYNKWFNTNYQGKENMATANFYRQMEKVPASFDFQSLLSNKNLGNKDIDYDPFPMSFPVDPSFGPLPTTEEKMQAMNDSRTMALGQGKNYGYDASTDSVQPLGDSGLYYNTVGGGEGEGTALDTTAFNRQLTETLGREETNKNKLMRGVNAAMIPVILGGMSYGLGAALGPVFAGAGATGAFGTTAAETAGLGATGTTLGAGGATAATATASGLAGMAGMAPGMLASGVNTAAGMGGAYAAQQVAEKMGLPVDSPLVQMLIPVIAGGLSGYAAGSAGAGVGSGVSGIENAPILGEGQLGGMTDLTNMDQIHSQILQKASDLGVDPDTYIQHISDGKMVSLDSYMKSASDYARSVSGAAGGTFTGNPYAKDAAQMGLKTGAKIAASPSGNMEMGGDQMSEYAAKQQMLESRAAQIQAAIDQLDAQSAGSTGRDALLSRQTGLQNQIQSNISGNKAYDPREQLLGVQGSLWR